MEPSFVANPYVQTTAPSSRHIREMLDQEDASYLSRRKARRPVRLPYASQKLNSPLNSKIILRHDSNQTNSQRTTPKTYEPIAKDAADQDKPRPTSSDHMSATLGLNELEKRKTVLNLRPLRCTRSRGIFPSLTAVQNFGQKQLQLTQAADQEPGRGIATCRRMTRKRFQEYLYDFHSRQVFSFAKSETDELVMTEKHDSVDILLAGESLKDNKKYQDERGLQLKDVGDPLGESEYTSMLSRQDERQNKCILSGLGVSFRGDYDAIFETDWELSEVEKIVRDAVDRKRIREILKQSYRMLLWFFRFYAGNAAYAVASERRGGTGAALALGEGLFEIPSRTRLLEDLNVQCVDAVRYGVTDSPLQRESVIEFILNVARMMCTHSSNPNRLRVVISDGVEMSDAVKTLVHDHFGAFAQIQDVDHFRHLFLSEPRGGTPRTLQFTIERHRTNLTRFFENQITASASTHSGALNDKKRGEQANGLLCTQFIATLCAINLIISRSAATTTTNSNATGEALGGPTGVEEVRAVRIFLSCLPMTPVVESIEQKNADAAASATTVTRRNNLEPRELTLHQFIEALLRVAFTWKELQICHGSFDVCPSQMTSDCCQCTLSAADFDFDVLDNAAEEIFGRIHAYQLKRAQQRTSMRMKSVRMKSMRSFQTLVTMTTAQKPPIRLLPVDGQVQSSDAAVPH